MAPAICRVANSCATTFVELWGSSLRVSPTEKSVARYTKAASTMWHTIAVCTPVLAATCRNGKVQMSADKVQTKYRVVYTTFCIENQSVK